MALKIEAAGVQEVRQQLADLTHRIMTRREAFLVERYGRPIAFLGPASLPDDIEEALAYLEMGAQEEAAIVLRGLVAEGT